MKTVKVIEPKGCERPGTEHEIPEQDLQGFLDNGWELAEDSSKNSKEKKK